MTAPLSNDMDDVSEEEIEMLIRLDDALAIGQQHVDPGNGRGELLDKFAKLRTVLAKAMEMQPRQEASTFTKLIAGNPQDLCVNIGRFQNLELIGTGGFGMVYRAFDPVLNRLVALKLPYRHASFLPQLTGNIFKEAQTNAQFDHPNIVPVYEAGEIEGVNYLALGLCTGPSLAQWLAKQETPIPIRTAVTIVKDIAAALACSHRQGIVHRDVKPANILLFPKSNVGKDEFAFTAKLTDFGLSKIAELSFLQSRSSIIVGTPAYVAPEQATGLSKVIGPPSDIYSLGVVLFELLTKTVPFPVNSFLGIVERSGKSQPESPKHFRSEIETDLESICLKCLQREPERRYANGEELEADLGKYLDGKPIAGKLPGALEQVIDWIRQPGRVSEAGAFSLILNATMSLWVLVNLFFTSPVLTQAEMQQSVITSILIIGFVHFPLCFTGFFTIRFSGKAIITGLILSIVPLLMALLTVMGYPGPFEDDYHSNPRLGIPLHHKQVLFGLLTFLCFLQTTYYGIAMLSHHRRKTRI